MTAGLYAGSDSNGWSAVLLPGMGQRPSSIPNRVNRRTTAQMIISWAALCDCPPNLGEHSEFAHLWRKNKNVEGSFHLTCRWCVLKAVVC